MLFTIIVLAIVITVFALLKKKIDKSKTRDACYAHQPLQEITTTPMVEESQLIEVETMSTVEVVPTTPPSVPTMAAKKKKKPAKKKPNQPK